MDDWLIYLLLLQDKVMKEELIEDTDSNYFMPSKKSKKNCKKCPYKKQK